VLVVSLPFFSEATVIGSDPVAAARMAAIPVRDMFSDMRVASTMVDRAEAALFFNHKPGGH
jgi:hypothetical protein